jgi:molybdopterin molybdotransferase
MTTDTHNLKSCDDPDPKTLNVGQAKERILESLTAIHESEDIPILEALSRITADTIKSPINVPSHTNSAMDGYALAGKGLPSEGSKEFIVAGTIFAGAPLSFTIKPGECARIMTGGKMPEGTDTVIMQEHVERHGDTISITAGHKHGQNVRHAGEDLAIGDTVLEKGRFLTPADIGMLASIGLSSVRVNRKLRVAFFSTGDELCQAGQELGEGQIYDSNRYTIYSMLKRLNVEIIDLGIIRDQRDRIENAFSEASGKADVLITSGGVSVGEADYVKEILDKVGQVGFWKIAMKPGKPLAFGHLGRCTFFGLPGNPVSTMVTFYQFVQPALQRMMGMTYSPPLLLKLKSLSKLKKKPGRVEYQRGVLVTDENGNTLVRITGQQGSGILSSMGNANCFIILSEESNGAEVGDFVTVQPFAGLI